MIPGRVSLAMTCGRDGAIVAAGLVLGNPVFLPRVTNSSSDQGRPSRGYLKCFLTTGRVPRIHHLLRRGGRPGRAGRSPIDWNLPARPTPSVLASFTVSGRQCSSWCGRPARPGRSPRLAGDILMADPGGRPLRPAGSGRFLPLRRSALDSFRPPEGTELTCGEPLDRLSPSFSKRALRRGRHSREQGDHVQGRGRQH